MQTINYYCDLCGRKIVYGRYRLWMAPTAEDETVHSSNYDVCTDCMNALNNWIGSRGMEVVDEKARKT